VTLADTSAAMSPALPEGVPTFDGTQTGGPVLLTPSQAAAVLGKSERTVLRRMDVPGKLPDGWTVTERGGKKLVRVADVRTLPGQSAVTVAAGEASVTGGAGSPPTGKAAAERERILDLVPKALPPGRPWWARLLNRGNREAHNG